MSAADREADSQGKRADDEDSMASRIAAVFNWCMYLRIAEFVIAGIGIGMLTCALYHSYLVDTDIRYTGASVYYSAYSSFIIITGVLVVTKLFGETIGWRTSMGFSALGVLMFTAAAGVVFHDLRKIRHPHLYPTGAYGLLLASGLVSTLEAVVFCVHAVLTFKKEADY